jgi:hypothetical protein
MIFVKAIFFVLGLLLLLTACMVGLSWHVGATPSGEALMSAILSIACTVICWWPLLRKW